MPLSKSTKPRFRRKKINLCNGNKMSKLNNSNER
jgi:hypothetical protein